MIVSGFCLLFRPELLYPYIAGFGIIVVGVLISLVAFLGR
jgi:hypothetical protein